MELKNARDGFVHRLGKSQPSKRTSFLDASVAFDGLKAVQSLIETVFAKTPEFSSRFIYRFLSFWSCNTDSPWIWDGCQGNAFHLGLGRIEFAQIMTLHAPVPAQFGEADDELNKQLTDMLRDNEATIGSKDPSERHAEPAAAPDRGGT